MTSPTAAFGIGGTFWRVGKLEECVPSKYTITCFQVLSEPQKKPLTFQYTGCLIGILLMAYYYNPI